MLARDKAQCCKWDAIFPQMIQDIRLSWNVYVCKSACVFVYLSHVCLSAGVAVCVRFCLPVCAPQSNAGSWAPTVPACYSAILLHTLSLSLLLSLPVCHDGEWSRCWGPIAALCHFLVLLISSLCCRWLSLKGSAHTHAPARKHTLPNTHTNSHATC